MTFFKTPLEARRQLILLLFIKEHLLQKRGELCCCFCRSVLLLAISYTVAVFTNFDVHFRAYNCSIDNDILDLLYLIEMKNSISFKKYLKQVASLLFILPFFFVFAGSVKADFTDTFTAADG